MSKKCITICPTISEKIFNCVIQNILFFLLVDKFHADAVIADNKTYARKQFISFWYFLLISSNLGFQISIEKKNVPTKIETFHIHIFEYR